MRESEKEKELRTKPWLFYFVELHDFCIDSLVQDE